MGRIIMDMSPSLDGYIAGRGVSIDRPFGDAGHRLHHWLGFGAAELTEVDHAVAKRMFETAGAVVIGRRMFDVGIEHWGDDGAFGMPCFVVTRRPMDNLVRGPTTFEFCESIPKALTLAQRAAAGRDIVVAGGADIAQQCLALGVVDELRLHIVPVLLGCGAPLFSGTQSLTELKTTDVLVSPNALHITFAVARP